MALPARLSGEAPRILATDRIVWPIRNPSQQGDLPVPGGLTWHSRSGRPLAEIKEVTAVSGNTITFSTPVHITYTTAKARAADQVHRRRQRLRSQLPASRT